jgi:hypothetical protein
MARDNIYPYILHLFFKIRKGAALSYVQVIEIFKLKDRSDGSRLVAPIARKYGVTPKAIRDIWNHSTWADLTTAPVEAADFIEQGPAYHPGQYFTGQDHPAFDRARSTCPKNQNFLPSISQPVCLLREWPGLPQPVSAVAVLAGDTGCSKATDVEVRQATRAHNGTALRHCGAHSRSTAT